MDPHKSQVEQVYRGVDARGKHGSSQKRQGRDVSKSHSSVIARTAMLNKQQSQMHKIGGMMNQLNNSAEEEQLRRQQNQSFSN